MTNTRFEVPCQTVATDHGRERYESPALQFVGRAADVILGFPGGGLDGPYGMTEPQFEFELDGDESL
jgi:hypothetical protein